MKQWNDAILSTFRKESLERLQALDTLLVSLEKNPQEEGVFAQVARELHTLKGSAKLLGIAKMAELAHRAEDVLSVVASGQLLPTAQVFTALFEVLDAVRHLTEAFAERREPTEDFTALSQRLVKLGDAPGAAATTTPTQPTKASEPPLRAPSLDAVPELPPPPRITPSSVTVKSAPPLSAASPLSGASPWSLAAPLSASGQESGGAAAQEKKRRHADTIRADISKLDTIMNLVGEAAIARIKAEGYLPQISGFVRRCEGARKLAVSLREELLAGQLTHEIQERLSHVALELANELKDLRVALRDFKLGFDTDTMQNKLLLEALQQEVAAIRMLPVDTVFTRFPRAVRDMAITHGKKVDLVLRGADVRLDQKVLETIEAPLIHILRNAVDHGVETPAERRRLGKPEVGTITMSAFQEGGRVAIVVSDDGQGLDPAVLRQTAVERGLLTPEQAGDLSDREAPYLICTTGFSTSGSITDDSGRGVGMDVVRSIVEECKGELEIDSVPGQSTTIKLVLPLTLAVSQVLMVQLGEQQLCIPTLSIEMVRKIAPDEIRLVADRPAVKVGRRSVPLVRLADVLQLPSSSAPDKNGELNAVFLGHARQRIAFVVDRLIAEQQVVIKTFGKILRGIPNVAGVTILGTGEVVMILHTPDLVKHGLSLAGKTAPLILSGSPAAAAREGKPVLVVEDSFSTREMEKDILEAAGWAVDTAVNGQDALEKSRSKSYGLFIVDLQMPVMDGFELVAALRRSRQHARTPIIIISSLSSEKDKRRGLELGADAYLVKAEFNQGLLVETVARFCGKAPGQAVS